MTSLISSRAKKRREVSYPFLRPRRRRATKLTSLRKEPERIHSEEGSREACVFRCHLMRDAKKRKKREPFLLVYPPLFLRSPQIVSCFLLAVFVSFNFQARFPSIPGTARVETKQMIAITKKRRGSCRQKARVEEEISTLCEHV